LNRLDPEVRKLCQAINALPGIKTTSSCCGHGQEPIRIVCTFDPEDMRGLALLTRASDLRYFRFGRYWSLTLAVSDLYDPNRGPASAITLLLSSKTKGPRGYKQADALADNIQYHLNHTAYLEGFGLASLKGMKIPFDPLWVPTT
jgi:hypothetical protein